MPDRHLCLKLQDNTAMETLEGKVVCITGASSGIGAATARLFAKYKSRLALHGRNVEKLTKVADECRQIGGLAEKDVLIVTGDNTKEDDVKKIAKAVIDHFHEIYCLVNNAGIGSLGTKITAVPLQNVDDMVTMHLRSPLQLSQLFMDELIKSKGSIVNVSSGAGLIASDVSADYAIAKAAMNHMSKCMALDVVKNGVRVNAVCPGYIRTNIAAAIGYASTEEESFKILEELGKTGGSGRAGKAEEIAQPIVFLASEAASYITGQVITVDGGFTLTARL